LPDHSVTAADQGVTYEWRVITGTANASDTTHSSNAAYTPDAANPTHASDAAYTSNSTNPTNPAEGANPC
jgi:hypothetical protein